MFVWLRFIASALQHRANKQAGEREGIEAMLLALLSSGILPCNAKQRMAAV